MQHETAASYLGAEKPKMAHQPMKEMHVKALHDGTFHMTKHHGNDHMGMPVKPHEEASAPDLDGVHDHLEEHFGGAASEEEFRGEGGKTKKQGHEEKAPEKEKKPTSEKAEKAGDAEESEE